MDPPGGPPFPPPPFAYAGASGAFAFPASPFDFPSCSGSGGFPGAASAPPKMAPALLGLQHITAALGPEPTTSMLSPGFGLPTAPLSHGHGPPPPLPQPGCSSSLPPKPAPFGSAAPPFGSPPKLPTTADKPSVDALDEALATLGQNYSLADFGVDELDDHLLRDAFFGEPRSLLHSILEYEPGSISAPTPAVPPGVDRPPPEAAVATPKLREKLKMRKEKELADLDKAFEWHLSRVMERNEKPAPALPPKMPPMPAFLPEPGSSKAASVLSESETASRVADSPVRFSPVHFSPANSPGPSTSSALLADVPRPEEELKVFIALPEAGRAGAGKSAVPIYKQGVKAPKTSSFRLPVAADKDDDDAYDFTDDEAAGPKDVVGTLVEHLKERRLEEEVNRKLQHISSLHPELRAAPGEVARATALPRRPGRRGRRPKDLGEAAGKAPEAPEAGGLSLVAQLSSVMQARRAARERHSYCSAVVAADNSTAAAAAAAVPVKTEPPEAPVDSVHQPSIIIRIPKAVIQLEGPSEDDSPGSHRKKRKKKKERKMKEDPDYVAPGDRRRSSSTHHHHKKRRHKDKRREVSCQAGAAIDAAPGLSVAAPTTNQVKASTAAEAPETGVPLAPMKIRLKLPQGDSTAAAYSKKKRLMTGWVPSASVEEERRPSLALSTDLDEAAATERLAQFEQPEGDVQKGTFLVCKDDIGKEDCPLWKVDNQNLLQKFAPEDKAGAIVYKSSSTYSGWAAQNSDQYLSVHVKFVEHSRSLSVVEPETPLVDLFPAVATEVAVGGELLLGGSRSPPECDQHQAEAAVPAALRAALRGYVHALLLHCLSGTFLQGLATSRDVELVRAVGAVEAALGSRKAAVAPPDWALDLRPLVATYPLCTSADSEVGGGISCQACGGCPAAKALQLFANEFYDPASLESRAPEPGPSGSPLPALERLVCGPCCARLLAFHRLSHLRYHLYKRCEEKVEGLREETPMLQPSALLDRCLGDKPWLAEALDEFVKAWKSV